MKKSHLAILAVFAAAALSLSACAQAPDASTGSSASSSTSAAGNDNSNSGEFKACMVSDSGGWDDQSFNQSGRAGLTKAVETLGIQEKLAESQGDADFTPNVDNMVQQGCNLTFGVGFLLEDAIQQAAEANTDTNFALIDSAFSDADFNPVELPNAKPILFNTAEASFLAGYLAAGYSQTGVVGTFGGHGGRVCGTDPLRGAGHDRDLVLEPAHDVLSSTSCEPMVLGR